VDIGLLEHCVREDLNKRSPRVMAVLHPIKLIIDNYPEGQVEWFDAENNPEDASAGTRKMPFSRVLYIEKDDYLENPSKKWFRLGPGREVRLKHGYYVTCESAVKDPQSGEVTELHCRYDPQTRGGWSDDKRDVRGTLHWVSAAHAIPAEVRLYDRLFTVPNPEDTEEGEDFTARVNTNSIEILGGCQVEPSLAEAKPGYRCQFLRQGYFCLDPDSTANKLVFNRTVSLRDTWAKIVGAEKK
jgi:glutaminyl-tRNA synthetase